MTREEQIGLFIKKSVEGIEDSDTRTAAAITLAAGIHWADSHPHWISVEEELPPFTHPEGASVKNTSDYVLVYNGYMVYISRLVGGEIKWWEDNSDVHPTHWMPLPQLPRKEDK